VNIAHSSPLGALMVPALGRDVASGEVVDVPKSIADPLLEQSDLWRVVTEKKEA
jgi:hypothetical protein